MFHHTLTYWEILHVIYLNRNNVWSKIFEVSLVEQNFKKIIFIWSQVKIYLFKKSSFILIEISISEVIDKIKYRYWHKKMSKFFNNRFSDTFKLFWYFWNTDIILLDETFIFRKNWKKCQFYESILTQNHKSKWSIVEGRATTKKP